MPSNVLSLRQPSAREPSLSDEALALACKTGDAAAVAELFERFREQVTRFISRMVNDPHDVEDLLQATFLEVARGGARFEGRSAVSTWLLGIAANVVRHHRRTMGRRRKLHQAYDGERGIAVPVVGHPDTETGRLIQKVERCLNALSEERRAAFVLCEIEGLSAREAGVALGCSETAIWKRVSEARRALRDAIMQEQP